VYHKPEKINEKNVGFERNESVVEFRGPVVFFGEFYLILGVYLQLFYSKLFGKPLKTRAVQYCIFTINTLPSQGIGNGDPIHHMPRPGHPRGVE